MQKVLFKGTILDFLSFLQAYVKRRQAPGMLSFAPNFSVEEPDIESITDSTGFAQFQIARVSHGFGSVRIEVLASKLPDKMTLLTATAKPPELMESLYGPMSVEKVPYFKAAGEKFWNIIVTELKEQGWVKENANTPLSERYDVQQLRQRLQDRLNLADVRDLCFELGVNFENLGESTLNGAVRELIIRMQQLERVDDLLRACKQLRPDLDL